ncbi:DNA-directed RNA polymerase subunit beta [Alteribacillus sp. HJP-4]|uniref:DNA-directed RNA polymerase subunit beta n=1 Tax=Alteribacillus sp. HJP-4 TaxID=2775394 RepID=UPI0035CCEA21
MTNKEPHTRQEKREEKEAAQQEEKKPSLFQRLKGERVRLIPIWARLLVISACLLISILAGLIVGYSIIGDGDSIFRVMSPGSWDSLFDFMHGE